MQRSTMQDAISAPKVGGIVRLTRFILNLGLQPVSQIICLVYIILVLPFSQEFIRIQIVALHLYPDVPLPAISFHGLQAL
ncbi:hypothetical protein OBE_14134, partial [human gut metagenome]